MVYLVLPRIREKMIGHASDGRKTRTQFDYFKGRTRSIKSTKIDVNNVDAMLVGALPGFDL
jgi:hypothetical protein